MWYSSSNDRYRDNNERWRLEFSPWVDDGRSPGDYLRREVENWRGVCDRCGYVTPEYQNWRVAWGLLCRHRNGEAHIKNLRNAPNGEPREVSKPHYWSMRP